MSGSPSESSAFDDKSGTVCFLCRQRKTKCDRKLPRCGFCIKAKVECQYVTKPKKRGLRAGYVSELEARLEAVENEVREIKRQRRTSDLTETLPTEALSNDPVANWSGRQQYSGTLGHLGEGRETIADLRSLPLPLLHNLVELWFKECQPWCPIIHRTAMQASLAALPSPVDRVDCVVLRAIFAIKISYSSQAINLGYAGRRRLSSYLRSAVLVEALNKISLSSLQALLIIALLDYGSDDAPSAWNLLSVCRRMCEQLGLFKQLLSQIQHQSPMNRGPPSRETFEEGDLAIALTWVWMALDSATTLGATWSDASASLMEHVASVAYLSTPDFSDSFRTATHLAAIGLQPAHAQFWHDTQTDAATLAACDETHRNLLTYVHSQALPTYTLLPDGSVDFDPNAVLGSLLVNASIICLYQRHVDLLTSADSVAKQRCLEACEEMITTIRSVSDADVELNSPLLGPRIFIAARFQLVLSRAMAQPRGPSFDVVMHGLNMCGRRWPIARRLDIVLRVAIVEVEALAAGGLDSENRLPAVFWDLKKSAVDINEDIRTFVEDYKPSLFIGSLNGAYA